MSDTPTEKPDADPDAVPIPNPAAKPSVAALLRGYVTGLEAFDPTTAPRMQGWYLCPCCRLPVLTARATYELCPVCGWEDDGQDDHNADEVTEGPNAPLSLTGARANMKAHGHAYGAGKSGNSPARQALRAFLARTGSGHIDIDAFHTLLAACDD